MYVRDMRVIIIIIIVEEGDLNTRECVTAIEDQYNFCIKRADLRQKCAPEKRWNCTNGQADEEVPAELYSDCSTQAITSAELVRISRFPDLAAVGSSWVGLPGGRGLEGEL